MLTFQLLAAASSGPGSYLISAVRGERGERREECSLANLHHCRSCQADLVKDGQCVICLSDFRSGVGVRRLACLHLFHTQCVDAWLLNNRVCPVCRVDVEASAAQERLQTGQYRNGAFLVFFFFEPLPTDKIFTKTFHHTQFPERNC